MNPIHIIAVPICLVSVVFIICFWHLYFPLPLHRLYRYRIVKLYYSDDSDDFAYVVQRKSWYFGFYKNFDVRVWERDDGETTIEGRQLCTNWFRNLENAKSFILKIKQIREDEYLASKNKKKDEII